MVLNTILGIVFCVLSGTWLIVKNCLAPFDSILLPLILWALWLGAGGLAATAAELLGKPVLPHALLGLCLPYVDPVLLIRSARKSAKEKKAQEEQAEKEAHAEQATALSARFQAMHEKRELERRERLAEKQGVRVEDIPERPVEKPAAAPVEEPQPEPVPETRSEIYDLLYAQPVDEAGNRPGPFQFTLTEGGTLDIDAVRQLAPQFMVCTVSGSGKSVRIKYAQVASVARYESET